MKDYTVRTNANWRKCRNAPFITVITPVYNRCKVLPRTMKSVEEQTFRDIEYIIIDDGSTDAIDDVVEKFMKSTKLPVMFVKKRNGGVHTARNIGYENARGDLILCIDSDDELLPDACKIFYDTWEAIPQSRRKEYWQMKAQCVDQDGNIAGTLFPNGVNSMPDDEAWKWFSMAKGEQIGCRVARVMKQNLFPEPVGVTFVAESIRWIPLERKYKSFGINDVVRVYHTDGDDHITKKTARSNRQNIRNKFWNVVYRVNDPKMFLPSPFRRLKFICGYCVLFQLLNYYGDGDFARRYRIKGAYNKAWAAIFWIPSLIVSAIMLTRVR